MNFTSGSFSSGSATVGLTASKHPNNGSTSDYISRYWTVTSSGISGFSCNVTAQYANADISGTESSMEGGKWNGSAWTSLGAVNDGNNQITGTVTSFSDFTAGEPTAFPVEWLGFHARPTKSSVLLNWTTANEQNADYFAIERSADQDIWTEQGRVQAAGNSREIQNYDFEDSSPLRGSAYYRLRQLDIDGSFHYSKTVEAYMDLIPTLIYPNPFQEEFYLEVADGQKLYVKFIDLQGKVMIETTIQGGLNTLNVSNLPAGVYILHMSDDSGWKREYQIVKE